MTTRDQSSLNDGAIPPDVLEHRQWLTGLLHLEAARCIVDLGCGQGEDLVLLAGRARSDAVLIGLDAWPAQIEKARARCEDDRRISFLEHRIGSDPLPLPNESVDVVYSNNLLECVQQPEVLVQEMHRILRPGGRIVCAHWDWDSQTIDADDKALVRRIIHALCDYQQKWMEHADGWMGRRLSGFFRQHERFEGLTRTRLLTNTRYEAPWYGYGRIQDVRELVAQGLVTESDYATLLQQVHARAESNRYFYSLTCYAFIGGRSSSLRRHSRL
jgi:ubiquinone/menaquinone biosynthesis C-methylase UbiE